MKTVLIEGLGDRILRAKDGNGNTIEEVLCFRKHGVFRLQTESEEVRVVGIYSPPDSNKATWLVGLQPTKCENPLPGWNFRFALSENENGYAMLIDLPDDAKVVAVNSD